MRHLILTLDFPPLHDGGVARSMDETARALTAAGQSVRVLTRGSGEDVTRHDASYPAAVTRWWGHHWQKIHPFLMALYLPRVGREEPGAIVHTSTWEVAPAIQSRAGRYGWKVFVHAQGREIAGSFTDPRKLARLKRALQAADAVLPISRHLADLVREAGAAPERVHLIPPSIDARRVQGGRGDRFRSRFNLGTRPVLLTLARLVDRKGQDTVIRSLPGILRGIPDLTYVLAGRGDYRDSLQQLARDLKVETNVVFTDFVADHDIPDIYAAADAYVMVSREGREAGDIEGFGITYLEASAAGLPVIAGNTAGAVDAVEHGVTGLLVDPTNVQAVGQAVLDVLRNPERARALGEAGKARVHRDFSLETRAAKIIRIAEQAARSRL
ncbi:MAG TPA: glycosyltransferase family 4 protein [Planctomycetota bacterium]|nr:glycosyltransferase family 4 protein [Planctomycetota bacterium]